jgi:hypothetical protein
MSQQVPSELLREVIREVLQDVIATEVREVVVASGGLASGRQAARSAGHGRSADEVIAIHSQADLDAAIRRVLADAANPARRAALQAGKVRFVLGDGRSSAGPAVSASAGGVQVHRIERGALTERHVKAAGQQGAAIHISRRVVVTPLAKERARAMGVQIVKEG